MSKAVRYRLRTNTKSARTSEGLASREIVHRPSRLKRKALQSPFARFRGISTVRMTTEEIMKLTRGA
jgi:hypothetical protein